MIAIVHRALGICFLYFLLVTMMQAQDRPIRRYYTQIMNQAVNNSDTDFGQTARSLERSQFENRRFNKTGKIEVPIVFHILYAPGQSYPTEQQVWEQIEMLNQDFASSNYTLTDTAADPEGFSDKTVDTEITFCIPRNIVGSKDNATGISFVETKIQEWGPDWAMCSAKLDGSDPVDPEHYLNVWVVDLPDTVSGWASYPAILELAREKPTQGYVDGIVIGFDFFGQDVSQGGTAVPYYNEGKTLTHLIGNYLGLYDLWNEYAMCGDDYVDDTPIHNAPNYGCQEYKHVSTCHEQPAEMVMNFMDNSDDICQRMFTLGQKLRMEGMFAPGAPRAGLLNTPTLCETEPMFLLSDDRTEAPNAVVAEVIQIPKLAIWPNPARQEIHMEILTPDAKQELLPGLLEIMIYNAQGQLQNRISGNLEGNAFRDQLNTSDWPAGKKHQTNQQQQYTNSNSFLYPLLFNQPR